MYRMMRDGNVGPRMCGVSSHFIRDGRSARGCRIRGWCELRSLVLVGTGLRLAPSPSGEGADGGSASSIRFRILVNHGSVSRAELD